jgi:hypothetical protein
MITKERVGAYIIALAQADAAADAAHRDAQNANLNLARELEISRQLAARVRELERDREFDLAVYDHARRERDDAVGKVQVLKHALDLAGAAVCDESACYLDAVSRLGDAEAEIDDMRRAVRLMLLAAFAVGAATAGLVSWLL